MRKYYPPPPPFFPAVARRTWDLYRAKPLVFRKLPERGIATRVIISPPSWSEIWKFCLFWTFIWCMRYEDEILYRSEPRKKHITILQIIHFEPISEDTCVIRNLRDLCCASSFVVFPSSLIAWWRSFKQCILNYSICVTTQRCFSRTIFMEDCICCGGWRWTNFWPLLDWWWC